MLQKKCKFTQTVKWPQSEMLSLSSSQCMTRKVKLLNAKLIWFLFRKENPPLCLGFSEQNRTFPALRYSHFWVSVPLLEGSWVIRLHLLTSRPPRIFKNAFLSIIKFVLSDRSSKSSQVLATKQTCHKYAAPWQSVALHYVKNYPFCSIQISSSCSLFCYFYRYFIMQSCWAFDSRKRPSFSNLTSCLGCQLADAEEAVCGNTALSQVGL